MLELTRWKIFLVMASAIFGLLFTLPNLLPDSVLDQVPASFRMTSSASGSTSKAAPIC
jgi:hypothetical protein